MGVSRINGQSLGRKGMETRRRLLAVGRQLLADVSPFQLTSVSICREAGLTAAAFYAYFPSLDDFLYALAEEVTQLLEDADIGYLHDPADLDAAIARLIDDIFAMHREHRPILQYRNVKAEQSEERFLALRTRASLPRIRMIADLVRAQGRDGAAITKSTAIARAVFINAAMESLSLFALQPFEKEQSVGWQKIRETQIYSIGILLRHG
ncbi:hypothetical protein BH10PSE13_BH10PSE13_18040 [soil metagenome]